MLIGWTTVESQDDAQSLADGLVEARLAVCVQIEGPITSTYRWEGQVEHSREFRLVVKFMATRHLELETWLLNHHRYTNPQWIVVRAEHVAEKYLSWAQANSSSLHL